MRAQLARAVAEFEAAVGPSDGARRNLRVALFADFGFILGYWVVLGAMSLLLSLQDFTAAAWLGAIAGEAATLGAVLDVTENVQALRLLTGSDEGAPQAVRRMRDASLAKWLFVFLSVGVLSVMFFERGSWYVVLGVALALASALGLATVFGNVAQRMLRLQDPVLDKCLRGAFVLMCLSVGIAFPFAAAIT